MGRHNRKAPWPLLFPSTGILVLMALLPLGALIFFSLLPDNPRPGMVIQLALVNYYKIFTKPLYLTLIWKSMRIGLLVTISCIAIAWPAAYGLAKVINERWRQTWLMSTIVPFLTSQLLLIYAIMVLLQAKGPVMSLLGFVGLAKSDTSILFTPKAVLFVLVYEYLPYMILSFYSTIQKIPDSLFEAARSLGAGRWRIFWSILFPLCLPAILLGVVLVFIPVVGSFVEPQILGGPDGMMIGSVINDQFSVVYDWGLGAALSFVLLLMLIIITLIFNILAGFATRRIEGETTS